jgi:hypothetical protein
MKQLIPLTTAAALLTAAPAVSAIPADVIQRCQKAVDFKGCADAVVNGVTSPEKKSELEQAMRKVSRRLQNRTILRDSDEVFRPVVDAIANAPESVQQQPIFQRAQKAESLFNIAQQTWQFRISSVKRLPPNYPEQWFVPSCRQMESLTRQFNATAGTRMVNWSWRKRGVFGLCEWSTDPEVLMIKAVSQVLLKEPLVEKDEGF